MGWPFGRRPRCYLVAACVHCCGEYLRGALAILVGGEAADAQAEHLTRFPHRQSDTQQNVRWQFGTRVARRAGGARHLALQELNHVPGVRDRQSNAEIPRVTMCRWADQTYACVNPSEQVQQLITELADPCALLVAVSTQNGARCAEPHTQWRWQGAGPQSVFLAAAIH